MKKGMIAQSVDDYIGQYPEEIRSRLERIRQIIRCEAPEATESIAYGMPAFKLHGKPLVYFGGYAGHVGFYATPNGHQAFAEALAPFKQGKGSVQFPHHCPLPEDLVASMVRFRVAEQVKCKKNGAERNDL